jgi:anaerobic magnesium-protoporphyrin IX monomethyl ester cyclase
MKIVLVLPPYDYTRSLGSRRKRKQIGLLPPLGAGYLSAWLEREGHEVALVDAVAEQFDVGKAVEAVLAREPDIIGISSFTTLRPNDAYPIAEALKQVRPDVPVVMGGPHVTAFTGAILEECPAVDILVPGDGEIPFGEIAGCLEKGQDWREVRGILYRDENGDCAATEPAEVVEDIDIFPHPARHIYKQDLYCPLPSLSPVRPATSIITSRGCPWSRCRFCYQGGCYAAPYRRRSPENVVDEIRCLHHDYGIRNIVVWDDNFCYGPDWVHRFCDLLEAEKLPVIWSILSRTNTVEDWMFKRMAAAGCYSVQFGIESGSPEILRMVRKGHTLDQCRKAVCLAKAAGLETRAFFMLGFPGETPAMARKTIDFACELNVDYAVFFAYYIAPGTDLEAESLAKGRRLDYTAQHLPSYVPDTYSGPEELAAMVKEAYRRYYFRPAWMARAIARMIRKPAILKNHIEGFYYWLGLMFSE